MKSTIRYKIIQKKKRPLCDYKGNCKNLAYKEVYPSLINKRKKVGIIYAKNILCKSKRD